MVDVHNVNVGSKPLQPIILIAKVAAQSKVLALITFLEIKIDLIKHGFCVCEGMLRPRYYYY